MAITNDDSFSDQQLSEKRMKGRTYLSKQWTDKYTDRKSRFAYKITDSEEQSIFVKVKEEIILERRSGGRHQLKALLVEDPRYIRELIIQTFTEKTGSPHKSAYSFRSEEIRNLYNFLRVLYEKDLPTKCKNLIDDAVLDSVLLSQSQAERIISDNEELLTTILRNKVTKHDILAIGYRRKQLEEFERFLCDSAYFDAEQKERFRGAEALWQAFLERNQWILGYGLSYVFNSSLEGKKLEQVVSGSTVFQRGKRTDALLKTQGIVNSLCFAEIKTHRTPLMKKTTDAYRGESWAISDEFAGAIAQIHRTIQRSVENIRTKVEIKDREDNPTGETLYFYKPRSFLLIGTLGEFQTEFGVNELKYSSFELFRRSVLDIEILTFDELFNRARFIVESQ